MGKDQYETFDSGSGPVIPDKGSYAHEDSSEGLESHGVEHGEVPEVPAQQK